LGFLFLGYKPQYYWYEIAIMARKAVFAMILVALYPQGLLWQVAMAVIVMMVAITASSSLAPFSDPLFNHLDIASLMLSVVTVAGGAILLQSKLVQDASRQAIASGDAAANVPAWPYYQQAGEAVTVILTGLNVVFVSVLIIWMLRSLYAAELAPRLQRASSKALTQRKVVARASKTASWRQGPSDQTPLAAGGVGNPMRGTLLRRSMVASSKHGGAGPSASGLLAQAKQRSQASGAIAGAGGVSLRTGSPNASGMNPLRT
jgi:hypothetical protein